MQMLYDAKIKEVFDDGNDLRVRSWDVHDFLAKLEDPTTVIQQKEEVIEGQTFITPDGRKIRVGISKDIQDFIGVNISAFKEKDLQIDRLRDDYALLQKAIKVLEQEKIKTSSRLLEIYNLSFFQRLKFLFTGVVPCTNQK